MNKMIFRSLMCFALCVLTLTAVSCGDDDDDNTGGGVIPVPQIASIVGNWMVTNAGEEPHIIFFKADGTGGFMEYSTSSGTYHQDGEFRWVQNADGSYSFSGAGLHDGIQAMAITSLNGDNMSLWLQWPGEEREYYTLKRTNVDPSAENGSNVQPAINIVGHWVVTDAGEGPHIIFFNTDGTGGFLEYSTSGNNYHQDGAFRWVRNMDGRYSFSGAGLNDGVYAAGIETLNDNNMRMWLQWGANKEKEYFSLRRMTSEEVAQIVIRDNNNGQAASIVGNWNIVRTACKRYHDGVLNSETDDVEQAPYDYIAINANGTGAYMEYGSSGYHQDGSFLWSETASGYNFSNSGSDDFADAVRIISYDGLNKMELEVQFSEQKTYLVKKVYHYYLQRQAQ